jgi:2-(1,2-epoxy-1,2-dihydrophenyl)acetyl-CoA isomerase
MNDGMSEDVLKVELTESILTVTLNRPERMNAFDHPLLKALAKTWEDARVPEVRAVVVTGAGRGFCAGMDVRRQPPPKPGDFSGLRASINPHVLAMAALAKPVIAAVNGVAAGAGLALACAADIRIASSEARFIPGYSRIGVIPDAGGTYYIPRVIGWSRAFEWLTSTEEVSASRALEWGLVNEVVKPEELLDRALSKARQLADMPGSAVGLTKALLRRSWSSSLSEQLEHEAELLPVALLAPGRAEVRAALVAQLSQPHTPSEPGEGTQ